MSKIDRLSELEIKKKYILRQINTNYRISETRANLFTQLNVINEEIKKEKFKINFLRRKNDKNNNPNEP